MKKYKLFVTAACAMLVSSCGNDFMDVDQTSVVTEKQIENLPPSEQAELITPLVQGLYGHFLNYYSSRSYGEDWGLTGMFLKLDTESNDVALNQAGAYGFDYTFQYNGAPYIRTAQHWSLFFTAISRANEALAKLDNPASTELKALKGQALAVRGFSYLYLAQKYQKTYIDHMDDPCVPLILTEDEGGARMERVPVKEIYEQVEKDCLEAIDLLQGWARTSKAQIDESVARGILARAYLVMNRWQDAADMAKEARVGYPIMTMDELKSTTFGDINEKEWMWGYDITANTTPMFASFASWCCSFDEGYGGAVGMYRSIDARLYEKFKENDVRKTQFVAPGTTVHVVYTESEANLPEYVNLKFKKVSGWLADYLYMRASEMVLIEAEAYAHLNQTGQAATVLRELMENRDPDWNETNVTVEDVYTQRRLELWGEGFSFFDLVRLKKPIDRIYPGSNHYSAGQIQLPAEDWKMYYQIPQREIDENESLTAADQNPLS